ncbi:DUF7108 family protein [Halovivax gelatinilyticus]|uniref:DUF7108 family protein n=1 Tax=Halovivax gelatinilyticus TaxID=2961597 RepID=UPI0020CA7657|nr:rnhA operon protein [Halovivax gelatinilyticus]
MTAPGANERPNADGKDTDERVDALLDDAIESPSEGSDDESTPDRFADEALPAALLRDVCRLTRLARRAVDENERTAYTDRRDELLAERGYTARLRETDETLVCHPASWLDDGVVRTDRIDDLSEAVELRLAGPGDPDDWDALDAANRDLVETVRTRHGDVHAANADTFADFMGNHCAKPIPSATATEIETFLAEYYPRNAWPSRAQRAVVTRSIEHVFDACGEPMPTISIPESLRTGGTEPDSFER